MSDLDSPQFRPLRGIVIPGLERDEKSLWCVFGRAHHHPAAEMIRFAESRVISGAQRQIAPFGQQQVGNRKAVRPIGACGAAVVIHLDRMGRRDAALQPPLPSRW